MTMTNASAATSPSETNCNPLDDPANEILGSNSGVVFLSPKHLDVIMQLPLPGIVIFVHGVNSDGEWYKQAEEGLCRGLNERLKRCKEHICYPVPAGGTLTPVEYLPELTPEGFVNPKLGAANFIAPTEHFSPVIHFRWGYKASAEELQQFSNGIYLNEHNYWGGGPFANGCTALPDLWGNGLSSRLFLWMHVQHLNPTKDRLVYACPPRPYFVVAALRLAMLVESIRKLQADAPITIVCHSQGNMIGMAAAFLGDRLAPVSDNRGKTGRCVADNYVLCNPPYSLVEENFQQAWTERDLKDADGHSGRQTAKARIDTLRAFFEIVGQQASTQQSADTIDEAMKNDVYGFDAKSDRGRFGFGPAVSTQGRVTLYFNPHDKVISTTTIQGIGWRGLSKEEIDAAGGTGIFCQRVFAQGFTVGKTGSYDFWHAQPASREDFWYPRSQVAGYSVSQGSEVNISFVGSILTFAMAPVMIVATRACKTPINALPPANWTTPLSAPDLPNEFVPEAMRFGIASKQFDQGMAAPGEYRDASTKRDANDPYAGDREMPKDATEEARRKGSDAAEGNVDTEAALKYEHHAMLRMKAKRAGLYKTSDKVLMEDEPESASREYKDWRTAKIRESLAAAIDTHATDHSTIMTNPEHSRKALAYDVAIGVCRIIQSEFSALRISADWRYLKKLEDNDPSKNFKQYFLRGLLEGVSVVEWSKTGNASMPPIIVNQRKLIL